MTADPDGADGPKIEIAEAVELRADGRTLSGHAVRYGALRRDGREMFAAGSFTAGNCTQPMRLVVGHDRALAEVVPLGIEYRADGPFISATLQEGRTADRVAAGELSGFSVGFVPLAEHRDEAGVRVIDRARLDHVALVARAAYVASAVELRESSRDDDLLWLLL